jgi:hypothetical protein
MARLCVAASAGAVEEPWAALCYLQALESLPEHQKRLLDNLATGFANTVSETWEKPIDRFEDELHWRPNGTPRLSGLWRSMLRNKIAFFTPELPDPADLEGWLDRQAGQALVQALTFNVATGLPRCRRVLVRETWQQLVRHSTVAARRQLDDEAYAPSWKAFWEGALAPAAAAGRSTISALADVEGIRAAFTEHVVGIVSGTVPVPS